MQNQYENKCYVTYNGLEVILGDNKQYLPCHIKSDQRIDDNPLPIEIDAYEFAELIYDDVSENKDDYTSAATDYGSPPPIQDKAENQDFALSARIKDSTEKTWLFSVVSDGVSTRTFWAARTSRIACLVAYQTVSGFIKKLDNTENQLSNLRLDLVDRLKKALSDDKVNLLKEQTIPNKWSERIFQKYRDDDKYWYNATLIISVLGPQYGFVIHAGDGGLCIIKQKSGKNIPIMVISSTDDVTINSFVSLAINEDQLRMATVDYSECEKIHIYSSSDGIDRSLQKTNWDYLFLLDRGWSAFDVIKSINARDIGLKEVDNYSLVKIGRTLQNVKISSYKAMETPVLETPVLETPVLETPVLETPVLETPVLETPILETPVLETPVLETPVLETPVLETPVLETPVLETPVLETPVLETPVLETPVLETPVLETPVLETPVLAPCYKENETGRRFTYEYPK